MAGIRTPVNTEALAVEHLDNDADVVDLAGEHVSTELPGNRANPWVQVTRLPGSTGATPETGRLERARLQVSIWADTKAGAWALTELVGRSLLDSPGSSNSYGVVTGAEYEVTPYWAPDPETDDPRYLFVMALFVHPA